MLVQNQPKKQKVLDATMTFRKNKKLIQQAHMAAEIDGISPSDFYRYAIRATAAKIIGNQQRSTQAQGNGGA